jgi:predicted nucleic acid-binding protein
MDIKNLDDLELAFVQNIINELSNQIEKDKDKIHPITFLAEKAILKINLLLTHIGYVETKSNQWKQIAKTFYELIPEETLNHYSLDCFCQNCVIIKTYQNLIKE